MSSSNGSSSMDNSQTKSCDLNGENTRKATRRCMFGCNDGSQTLCRFPVHDAQRCQDWVDFFQVSEEHIRNNSLVNLRVCMKHFKEKVVMINGKVTRHPSADSNNSNQSSTGTKRSRQHSPTSAWSGVNDGNGSRASSVHSDYTSDSETKSKRSNDSLKKLPLEMINGGNRKLFVITPSDSNAMPGQKTKMFLILENGDDNDETKKHQKITLIADKSDAQTAEKIEHLLPQLIERIQSVNEAKLLSSANAKETVTLLDSDEDEESQHSQHSVKEDEDDEEESSELPLKIQRVQTLAKEQTKPSTPAKPAEPRAVNLSPDFLFLMKMLPKLEAIADPFKTHIKNRIESMLDELA